MDVNFELYKVFYYIAKEGSITSAAEKLFISPPAVTQSLKKLEEELGGPLFIRKKSGVTLTVEGQKLYEFIEDSIHTLNNAENLFSQYINSEIGKVRVNVGGSFGISLMPEILKRYHEKYPKVEVSVSIDKTSDAVRKLSNGDIDISFFEGNVSQYADELELMELGNANYEFYTSKAYLEKVGTIDVNHLDNYEFLLPKADSNRMAMLKEKLNKKGIEITSNRYIAGNEMVKNMVKMGLGIGFLSEVSKEERSELIKVDLGIETVKGKLTLAVKNKKLMSSAGIHLLNIMEEVIQENGNQ